MVVSAFCIRSNDDAICTASIIGVCIRLDLERPIECYTPHDLPKGALQLTILQITISPLSLTAAVAQHSCVQLCRIPDRLLSEAVGDPNYKGTDEPLPDATSSVRKATKTQSRYP